MKNVLIINLVGMGLDGITSVILNYANQINRDGLQLTFTRFGDTPKTLREEFGVLGTVYDLPHRKENTFAYLHALREVLKSNHYDAVHIHGNSGTMMIEASLARMLGIKKIIVHCHSTSCNHPILNKFMVPVMKAMATDLVACSQQSGKWLYREAPFVVFNNAIDLGKYHYCEKIRQETRNELKISNQLLIGHIGHFTETKNQAFLLECFEKVHKSIPASKLLLVSDGPLFDAVKQKVQTLELEDAVIFAGRREDCEKLYQAMDLFVLPSKWEGLPLVTLEAQAASLPALVSKAVPPEAGCTSLIEWLDLKHGPERWAERMIQMLEKHHDRHVSTEKEIAAAGFDIRREAEKMRKLYLN